MGVALNELHADRVVLAGIPLTRQAGHCDEAGDWRDAEKYRREWQDSADEMRPYVRSMSGWTRELLGEPTSEWLAGGDA
jgi:hypothetical protein